MKKHFAWVICAVCVLLHLCACGLVVTSFSVYLPLLKDYLNLSNTQISMINTARCLSSMMAMMAANKYYQKLTLRQGTALACLMVPAACVVFSFANSAMICYLAAIIMGAAFGFGTMIPISILMHNWFNSRCSTAIGICACGSSIATIFAPPVISGLAEDIGLRYTFLIEAVLVLGCAVIIYMVLRDTPAEIGLEAYKEAQTEIKSQKKAVMLQKNLSSIEWILMMTVAFIVGAAGTPATANMTIHYVTSGYTQMQAASALSVFGIVMVIGKFSFGTVCDRIGAYRSNYIYVLCWAIAEFVTAFVDGQSMWMLMLSVVLTGMGTSVGSLGISYWTSDFATEDEYAKRLQRNQAIFSIGGLLMAPFPGIVADATGNYQAAYALLGIMIIIFLIIIQMIYIRHCKIVETN